MQSADLFSDLDFRSWKNVYTENACGKLLDLLSALNSSPVSFNAHVFTVCVKAFKSPVFFTHPHGSHVQPLRS